VPGKDITPKLRVAVAVCSLVLALGGQAAEILPKFLGAQSCASSGCHGGADAKHNQNIIWAQRDFHTRAPATLSIGRSRLMEQTLKGEDATTDSRCTVCHNPFQSVPAERKGPLVQKLEGVSCESCHNAAENWLLTHTRTDLNYEQKVNAGMRDLKNLYVRANTCVACHQNLESDVRRAAHPELTFELDGQCVTMPRHWVETNRLRGAQAWLVGQAVALREAVAQQGGSNGTEASSQRIAALSWLLDLNADAKAPDDLARKVAQENWNAGDVKARLMKLAANSKVFENAPAGKGEFAQHAERLVLGLDRLTVALGINKNAAISPKLDALFKDVQSRPDFDAKKFARDLAAFEAAVKAVAR
jgi:hypothetical protein